MRLSLLSLLLITILLSSGTLIIIHAEQNTQKLDQQDKTASNIQNKVFHALTSQTKEETCATPKVPLFQTCKDTYPDQATFCCLRGCGCCVGQSTCVITCQEPTTESTSLLVACAKNGGTSGPLVSIFVWIISFITISNTCV
jgi:hypothetical protein